MAAVQTDSEFRRDAAANCSPAIRLARRQTWGNRHTSNIQYYTLAYKKFLFLSYIIHLYKLQRMALITVTTHGIIGIIVYLIVNIIIKNR